MEAGSWFHSLGPEIENARSSVLRSALDCVLGMYSLKELADLRPGHYQIAVRLRKNRVMNAQLRFIEIVLFVIATGTKGIHFLP